MNIKTYIYSIYNKIKWFWPYATFTNYLYTELFSFFNNFGSAVESKRGVSNIRIAIICDEMTWQNFYPECHALFLTPRNWKNALIDFKPQLFFCESTWSGIEVRPDCWRSRIYKSKNIRRNNRKILFDILDWCKSNRTPTIFWNKEDPAFFFNTLYNFVDTALQFDYIFTTASECIEKYKQLGHSRINLLPFGFSQCIFYPDDSIAKENTAVFAGSWYANEPIRCRDMVNVFDFVISNGIALIIYDRQSGSSNPNNRFPDKYYKYINSAVSYKALGNIYRKSKYCVNINTVTESESMFARRVYEAMACKCIIISNESKSLRNQFDGKIWFLNEYINNNNINQIVNENCKYVLYNHTWKHRYEYIISFIK